MAHRGASSVARAGHLRGGGQAGTAAGGGNRGTQPAAARGHGHGRGQRRRAEGLAVLAVFCVLTIMPAGVTPLARSDVWSFAGHAHGIVQRLEVRGPSDHDLHAVWVWRPPGPDSARLPVLYFLHGNPGGPGNAFRHGLAAVLDQRLEDGYPPFVVACPDGNGEHHADSEWADSADGTDLVESRLLDAVIPAVEEGHRRAADRRAIAGFSMGGYGAMNIALRHPGLFGQVVSIAGYFRVDDPGDVFGGDAALIAANSPGHNVVRARGERIMLAEDRSDDIAVIKGQAAWFDTLLGRARIAATLRVTPGQHDWAYAMTALAGAIDFLADGWAYAALAVPRPTARPAARARRATRPRGTGAPGT